MNAPTFLVKQAGGLDVLAVIPAQLGFKPRDSVVIGGFNPPRGRLGLVLRVDRAPAGGPGLEAYALAQADRLFDSGARASFLARYAPADAPKAADDACFWEWVGAVGRRLPVIGCWDVVAGAGAGAAGAVGAAGAADAGAAGVLGTAGGPGGGDVTGVTGVIGGEAGETYQEIDIATRQPVGPAYGVADLQSTRAAAVVALAGLAPKAGREDLAKIVPAPEAARRAARAAERCATDQMLAVGAAGLRRWRSRGLERWLRCSRLLADNPGAAVDPREIGRLSVVLTDAHARDAVMATAFKGGGRTARRLVMGAQGGDIFDPLTSEGVDHARVEVGLALAAQIAAHLPARRRGAVYGLGAAWHWWSGNGPAAEEWARAAMDCVNCPQLALLVLAVVVEGIFPSALVAEAR
ncbi:MAG: DUF4192 domain-containing protein [Bifidobacteriaceae bacterium]|jgi:hypothetical protein|nr:DUF4192 domain-containing protein [Bifidobacteriaceae bacterium]